MIKPATYIRDALKGFYPPEEVQALVRLIMERICGISTYQLLLGKDKDLSDTEKSKIKEIVNGLRAYKPIQYLLGIADFYGMEFKVTPAVLIPRPETAELVNRIVQDFQGQTPRVLDIGTGSGCIAITLAKHLPKTRVMAIDISAEALAIAEENARTNKVEALFARFDILSADTADKLCPEESFDCVVSNPPYVMEKEKKEMEANVLENEPHLALFVPDDDPLLFYQAISRFARKRLSENGRLYLEINARCGQAIQALLKADGFTNVELIQDLYGKDRFIKAKYRT